MKIWGLLLTFLCVGLHGAQSSAASSKDESSVSAEVSKIYEDLKKLPYNDSLASDLSLLEQITSGARLGRYTELSEHFEPEKDGRDYLIDQADNFSKTPNLGAYIKQYFEMKERPGDALYRYLIYADTQSPPKGIVIDYYGGFFKDFFDSGYLGATERLLVSNGYTVISLQTRDNWQTISQDTQFRTPAGKELLQDTIMSLFLFVKAVKEKYPSIPVYYNGASFGGTKGALANLVLSNKGSLASVFTPEFQEFAISLETDLKQYEIDNSLFQGYVVHDG